MAWQRESNHPSPYYRIDSDTSIRSLIETEYSDDERLLTRTLYSLVVMRMEPGETVENTEDIWLDALTLDNDFDRIVAIHPFEYPPIREARKRILLAEEEVNLTEIDDLLKQIRVKIHSSGDSCETNFTQSGVGHQLVFVMLAATAQGAGTAVSLTALRATLRGVQARSRYKRLLGREAEAIEETRRTAQHAIAGSADWTVGEVALDETDGVMRVTLIHPEDAMTSADQARWIKCEIRPHGDWFIAKVVKSNRLDWNQPKSSDSNLAESL